MGSFLLNPVSTVIEDYYESKDFVVGAAEMNGYRATMEDAHLVLLKNGWAVCGIFDGHCDNKCSEFVCKRIGDFLSNLGEVVDIANGALTDDDMVNMCFSIDKECESRGILESGTTAVFCIIHSIKEEGAKIKICNVGDSRLSICRPGIGAIYTTIDHKPSFIGEKARIEAAGSFVYRDRVDGQLAVSRAFGDFGFKKRFLGKEELFKQAVIAKPDIVNMDIKCDDYILLYCDGMYEANFLPQEVATKSDINKYIRMNRPSETCGMLIHEALFKGSKDNISAMIVRLATPGEITIPSHLRTYEAGSVYGMEDEDFRKAYTAMAERAGASFDEAVAQRMEFLKKRSMEEEKEREQKPDGLTDGMVAELLRHNDLVSCGNSMLDRLMISQGEFLRFVSIEDNGQSKVFYYKTALLFNEKPTWSNGLKGTNSRCIFYANDHWIISDSIGGRIFLRTNDTMENEMPYETSEWVSDTDVSDFPLLVLRLVKLRIPLNAQSGIQDEIVETEKYLK